MNIEKSKNKKLILLLIAIVTLFLIQAIYLVYFQLFRANDLNNDPLNARNYIDETKMQRGTIYDRNGKMLAYSDETENGFVRYNVYNYLYSNIIGYNSKRFGKSGIELSYNKELLNLTKDGDIFSKLDGLIDKNKKGNDVYLTIDDNLQSFVYDTMGDNKGSVIVANPKTGKILSMVSNPSFNVNKFEKDWDEINSSEDGILLNRATNGLYEPGSIFKVLTSLTFLNSGIDLNYYDTGEATIGDHTVHNYNMNAYGEMDLRKALEVSSNTYFFEKSKLISNQEFLDTIKDFGIGLKTNFPLGRNESIFPFEQGLSDLEKANASFGQGQTYVTPIDMIQIAMGIANNGTVYEPYIVEKVVKEGATETTTPKVLSNKINPNYAKLIRDYLTSTALHNGYVLSSNKTLAGKTGTADTHSNKNNSWYMGISPADNPEYVIIVVIEATDKLAGEIAAPIATNILDYIYMNDINN